MKWTCETTDSVLCHALIAPEYDSYVHSNIIWERPHAVFTELLRHMRR